MWVATVGGKMIDGETPEQAALRELAEEVGLVPFSANFVDIFRSEERRQFEYVFIFSVDSQTVPDKISAEVAELLWLDICGCISLLQQKRNWYEYGYETDILESLITGV
jgi:8-oxo-dGTP pyrophosphatase MutT (NUDIX family)